jgi:hypothetical protein
MKISNNFSRIHGLAHLLVRATSRFSQSRFTSAATRVLARSLTVAALLGHGRTRGRAGALPYQILVAGLLGCRRIYHFLTVVALLLAFAASCGAQTNTVPPPTQWSIVSRAADSEILSQTTSHPSPTGQAVQQVHHVTRIASGLNYWDGTAWQRSDPTFEMSQDGQYAYANKVQMKIQLAANLATTNSVTITTPDGIVLSTTPVAIGLYNAASGSATIIASITNCSGTLISSNRVLYENCFNGLSGSIMYTLERGSFSQDIIWQQNIDPSDYNFPTNSTRIQIFSAFDSPAPQEIARPLYVETNEAVRAQMASPDFIQPDPEIPDPTDSQSFNRYSYCRNNPLNETDPSGFDTEGDDTGVYNLGNINLPSDGGGGGLSWGQIGNLFGGTIGGWLGSAADTYNSLNSTSFNFTQFQNGNLSGFDFSFNSGGDGWNLGAIFSNGTAFENYNNSIGPTLAGAPLNLSPPSDPITIPSITPPPTSNGWLTGITNAAGWASMIPGPVGTIAGLVNAGGEALQGHWGAAGIGVGGAVLATVGLGVLGKVAGRGLYEVGLAKDLRNAPRLFTQAHHVPQIAQARSLVGDYNMASDAGNEVAIRITASEHIAINAAQATRPIVPATARQLLAHDIKMLRNNTGAPNAALQKLIQMNKDLHPTDFEKY